MAARADREAPRGGRLNNLLPMTKAELESKHLAELHTLAAEAGVAGYRMLRREELVEKLSADGRAAKPKRERDGEGRERDGGGRRRRSGGQARGGGQARSGGQAREPRERSERGERPQRQRSSQRPPRQRTEPRAEPRAEPPAQPEREERAEPASGGEPSRPRRKRRRRFGRKRKDLRLNDLLSPATPGRHAIVYAETREACTALLRELAAELGGGSNGPDPVALLVDPGPEELADWRREAPRAEIVAAAQARHAEDALAQAAKRAGEGEEVVVLIDSLTRFGEAFGDADAARALLDGAGSVTVVAALERR
jgi:hypothetical protein